jgi:uncharacterized caspase-like protein
MTLHPAALSAGGNPTNDSGAMSETLKSAGFDVVELKRDLNVSEMRRALRDISDTVRDADVAIVYFAGHGIEIDDTNYVIPVDATLERDIDAFDEAIPLDRIFDGHRAGAATTARHSGRMSRQSVRQDHEAHDRIARGRSRAGQDRYAKTNTAVAVTTDQDGSIANNRLAPLKKGGSPSATRRYHVPPRQRDAFCAVRSWVDCITNMLGLDLR